MPPGIGIGRCKASGLPPASGQHLVIAGCDDGAHLARRRLRTGALPHRLREKIDSLFWAVALRVEEAGETQLHTIDVLPPIEETGLVQVSGISTKWGRLREARVPRSFVGDAAIHATGVYPEVLSFPLLSLTGMVTAERHNASP